MQAEEVEALKNKAHRLEVACAEVLKHLKEFMADQGDCDHSVGICVCDIKRAIRNADMVLQNRKYLCSICETETANEDHMCETCWNRSYADA